MCNIHHEDIRQIWTNQILNENTTGEDYDRIWGIVNEILESIEEGITTLCIERYPLDSRGFYYKKDLELMKEAVKGFFIELRGD